MLNFIISTAKKAGEYIVKNDSNSLVIEHKGRIDLVTDKDKNSQEIIIKEIKKNFPKHSIIAEEGINIKGNEDFVWYIDPIDGTTNFVHGVPIFCVSLAVYYKNEPIAGVCYNPVNKETFCAEKGKGAYCNDQRIQVSLTKNLVDALIATGFPYQSANLRFIVDKFFKVVSSAQGVRRLGSAALDLCYVACGRFDAFWEMELKP